MKFSFNGLNVIDVLCSPFPRSPRLIIVFILLSHSRRRNDPLHTGRMELSSAALCEYCRVLTISWGTAELRPFIRISTHCDSRLVVSFILLKEASCCTNNKQIIHSFSARPFLNTTTQSNENTHAYSPHTLLSSCFPVWSSNSSIARITSSPIMIIVTQHDQDQARRPGHSG